MKGVNSEAIEKRIKILKDEIKKMKDEIKILQNIIKQSKKLGIAVDEEKEDLNSERGD